MCYSDSCHSTRQRIAKCQYPVSGVDYVNATATERERNFSQIVKERDGDRFATKSEEVSQVKGAGSGERGMRTENAVLEYCPLSAVTALQLVD